MLTGAQYNVPICGHIHTCVHAQIHTCTHVHTLKQPTMHESPHVLMCTHAYIVRYRCTLKHTVHPYTHTCVYTQPHVYTFPCIWAHTYTHVHTPAEVQRASHGDPPGQCLAVRLSQPGNHWHPWSQALQGQLPGQGPPPYRPSPHGRTSKGHPMPTPEVEPTLSVGEGRTSSC